MSQYHYMYNKALNQVAKDLRNNPTPEEEKLWFDFFRNYPVKCRRQKIIEKYVADFYCPSAKLVIEIDGKQHYGEEAKEYDAVRTEVFALHGVEVIRISNEDVNNNFESVCDYIDKEIQKRLMNPTVTP